MFITLYSPQSWQVPDLLFGPRNNTLTRKTGTLSELDEKVMVNEPDVLFLHGFENNALLIAKIANLCLTHPRVAIIPSCENPSPEFLLSLMRSGVREVLTQETTDAVSEALSRAMAKRSFMALNHTDGPLGRTIALVSAKGGDGATYLSANLAAAIAENPECRVLTIDLSLPFGDLDMYLTGEATTNNLATFSIEIERIDGALLESMAHHISSNLHMIPSPSIFDESFQVNPASVQKLIQIARGSYQFIILDLGSQVGPFGMKFLENIDELTLVASSNICSIRHAGQILRLLEGLGFDGEKVSLVLNRYEERGELTVSHICKVVGKQVSQTFPNDAELIEGAILKGAPLIKVNPKSKLARAILDWSSIWSGLTHNKGNALWRLLKIR